MDAMSKAEEVAALAKEVKACKYCDHRSDAYSCFGKEGPSATFSQFKRNVRIFSSRIFR